MLTSGLLSVFDLEPSKPSNIIDSGASTSHQTIEQQSLTGNTNKTETQTKKSSKWTRFLGLFKKKSKIKTKTLKPAKTPGWKRLFGCIG